MRIGGVLLPESLDLEGHSLILNGAGIRRFLFLNVYAGALYLVRAERSAARIITADEAMAVRMHFILPNLPRSKMLDAMWKGFEASTRGNVHPFRSKIEYLLEESFGHTLSRNDIIDLVHVPGPGISLYKNHVKMGTMDGLDFKQAVFGIWLGDQPVDRDLKRGMLG